MKDKFFLLIGILIIAWSFYAVLQRPAPAKYQKTDNSLQLSVNSFIRIGDKNISVEIADTDEERTLGLSGRESLESDYGLLFVFDTPGKYGFWMHDMNFSIDIIWIDENWKVVGIERLVNPDTYPKIFYPIETIKYVLEINSGESSRLGIDTGSVLSFVE